MQDGERGLVVVTRGGGKDTEVGLPFPLSGRSLVRCGVVGSSFSYHLVGWQCSRDPGMPLVSTLGTCCTTPSDRLYFSRILGTAFESNGQNTQTHALSWFLALPAIQHWIRGKNKQIWWSGRVLG